METIQKNAPMELATRIDEAVERGILATQMSGRMSRALAKAAAMNDIRAGLSVPGMMSDVMALQCTAVGFKTDKDQSGGYPENIVRDCMIEAMMAGVDLIGNEFNIIAGRAYITKEGMGRKLRDIQGLSYSITPGIPEMKNGGAIVPMSIEWTLVGRSDARALPVCVKVNNGMGADAIIGKATRKARAWLYQTVTGSEISDGEAEASVEINITPKKSPFEKVLKDIPPSQVMDERPFLDRLKDAAADAGITAAELDYWAGQRHGAKSVDEIDTSKFGRMSGFPMPEIIGQIAKTVSTMAQASFKEAGQ